MILIWYPAIKEYEKYLKMIKTLSYMCYSSVCEFLLENQTFFLRIIFIFFNFLLGKGAVLKCFIDIHKIFQEMTQLIF